MKKVFAFIGTFALTCILFILPSVAERISDGPASMTMATESGEVVFTINEVEVYPSLPYTENGACIKKIDIWISEKRIIENPEFLIYCYDKDGNHIDSEYTAMKYDNRYSQYYGKIYVNADTASVELLPANPGGWYNSYYYCRYDGISAADGRKMSVHDMLIPNYESVGWYADVYVYALDGRSMKISHCDVNAYKAVGWYEWEDIRMIEFREYYSRGINNWDYERILERIDSLKGLIKNPSYLQELAEAQCRTMDKWRVEIGEPMALVNYHVFYDEEDGKDYMMLELRNVSYGTITAYNTSFVCHNISGGITKGESVYYSEGTNLSPGAKGTFCFMLDNYDTNYISDFDVRYVMFSDGASWYK